jgi:uncharacterized protein (TIRG00374 family)
VWLGVALTLVFVWLALRDVDTAEVARAIAGANWGILLGISVPAYAATIWVRALRWRHLTDPIRPIATAPLARAVSVGFMANNVFPLRIGEVVRCWYLARETGASAAAVFGTVILERVIDTLCVMLLVVLVLVLRGGGDAELERGALFLIPVAVLPILFLMALRAAPDRVVGLARKTLVFAPRLAEFVERMLLRFTEGLGALRGGRHLAWIGLHSISLWLVLSVPPIAAAFLALGIDLGSSSRMIQAAWTTQAAIGVAVAVPSAPGFFGVFHFACRLALVRFGVGADAAVAAGTLIHAVMWITLTAAGFLVLRIRRTRLPDIDAAPADSGSLPPR